MMVFEMKSRMRWKVQHITMRSKGLLTKELQEPEMVKSGVWMIRHRKPQYSKTGEPEGNAWRALMSLKASVSEGEKIS